MAAPALIETLAVAQAGSAGVIFGLSGFGKLMDAHGGAVAQRSGLARLLSKPRLILTAWYAIAATELVAGLALVIRPGDKALESIAATLAVGSLGYLAWSMRWANNRTCG